MHYGDFEAEIKTYLEAKISINNLLFQTLPESEAEFELPFGKSMVTVAFSKEDPELTSKSTFVTFQEVTRHFSVLVQSRSLRAPDGIYPVIAEVKKHMRSLRPSFGDKFLYAGVDPLGRERGFFEYVVKFQSKGVEVEEQEEDEGPLLEEVHAI